MGTLYLGMRAIHVDDTTGLYWDSPEKRFRFNADGSDYIENQPIEFATLHYEATTTIAIEPKVETETVIETAREVIDNPTTCSVCQFTAKSLAGLAVHKKIKGH